MSYASKRNIVSIVTGVALLIAYYIFAVGAGAPATENIKAWAAVILVFIGIGIGIQIVAQIVFHIALTIGFAVKEEIKAEIKSGSKTDGKDSGKLAERVINAEMVEDDRSKLIDLKSSRIGSWVVSVGLVIAIITLAVGLEAVYALHVIFAVCAFASVAEGIAGITYHERGVK